VTLATWVRMPRAQTPSPVVFGTSSARGGGEPGGDDAVDDAGDVKGLAALAPVPLPFVAPSAVVPSPGDAGPEGTGGRMTGSIE